MQEIKDISMKTLLYCTLIFCIPLLFACSSDGATAGKTNKTANKTANNTVSENKTNNTAPGFNAASGNDTNKTVPSKNTIAKDITVAEIRTLQQEKPNLQILDVRTPGEIAEGKIDGSIAIDIQSKSFKLKVGALDPNQPTMVYCKSGRRSARAMKLMKNMGFNEVYNLKGGYIAYKKDH